MRGGERHGICTSIDKHLDTRWKAIDACLDGFKALFIGNGILLPAAKDVRTDR